MAAFGEGANEAATDSLIHRSAHADYQVDVAMALAKRMGRPPREVAASIIEHLDAGDVCAKLEVAGPGFINVRLRDDFLAQNLTAAAREPELRIAPATAPETVVVDYSSPNVAKEMHVGHLRSTIIGDSLARVLDAVGHRVIRQNHIGDWGTPFGMLIEHLLDIGGAAGEVSIADLDSFYREARAKFDSNSAFAERSRARVVRLQGGDEATLKLWRRLVAESTRYFAAIYRRLDVSLDDTDVAGESFYNPMLADVVTELERIGLAVEDAGAICAIPPGFTGKGGSALPLIVRKQDGGYNYAATDLAALRHRVNTLAARRLLYVVGAPQAQHLAMVFATARQADWLPPQVRAEHVAFGSVLGPDKKPFKSRGGESIKLMALIEEAEARAGAVVREKNPELDAGSIEAIAHAVGIGSIKYADLSTHRIKDYVFDWDRMLALEGNTAPCTPMRAFAPSCAGSMTGRPTKRRSCCRTPPSGHWRSNLSSASRSCKTLQGHSNRSGCAAIFTGSPARSRFSTGIARCCARIPKSNAVRASCSAIRSLGYSRIISAFWASRRPSACRDRSHALTALDWQQVDCLPSRPREFHPEPLTDSGLDTLASSGSCHRTKAAA
jgi:arginyl-tRNA synthetase